MRTLYLIHHNRPELLKAQIKILKNYNKSDSIILVLTCDASKNKFIFSEFFTIATDEKIKIIFSDTNMNITERLMNRFFALKFIRGLILRMPKIRQKFGQDPSSGHARALNKALKNTLNLQDNSEIWIIEGDIFPLRNFSLGTNSIFGSVTNLENDQKTYYNGRVFGFTMNSGIRKLILSKKLTFSSQHTFGKWFDTGSKTERLIKSHSLQGNLILGQMVSLTDGSWSSADIAKLDKQFNGFRKLTEIDLRREFENSAFDLYDDKWLHIGKASGYFKFRGNFDFDSFCLEVIKFVLKVCIK